LTTTTTASNNNSKKDNNSYHHHEEDESQNEHITTYRILHVDDDPDILLTFKKGLEDDKSTALGEGVKVQVDTFADPKEALTSFKAGIYDLLLLDIRMPNINGFELYEELKKIDDKPRVCFITAYELYYEVLKKDFPELDVGCFIKKPISIEDLATKIRKELALQL
jgi:two-component system, OmpR family, response regulator ChvI